MIAAYSAEIHLMPDWTFFAQLGIFLLAAAAMSFFMFRPMLRLLDKRREYTTGADRRAAVIDTKADDLEKLRAKELTDEIGGIQNERAAELSRTQRDAEKMVSEAKTLAKKRMKDAEAGIESSRKAIAADIGRRASDMADEMVSKLML